MLVAERYQKIVDLVNKRGSVRVTELSEICKVTEETIRRDLDRLENEGKLRRSHGGAIIAKENQLEIPYTEREVLHADEKKLIAREAIQHISPRDRIILDASSTAWYMASILPDIPLTVITNSIKVVMELSAKGNIQVISTGGLLAPGSLSYVGALAERSLDQYHVDKVFLSCKGVHFQRGVSESNELQSLVKRKMLDISERVYLLVDNSKFGIQSFAHVAGLEQIDCIVTDSKTDLEHIEQLRETRCEVIVVG